MDKKISYCNRSSLIRDICDKKRIRYEQEGKTLVLNAFNYSTVKECYLNLQIINVEERVTNQEEGIYKTIRKRKKIYMLSKKDIVE